MRLAIRIFLYGILSLVIALWLVLGLFKPDYLKAPLAAWIQQQTGLPLTIGRLEFNPFYPNVLLVEQIQLGDDIRAEKLYIEIASGSWFERRIDVAHLDLIAPQIKLKPQQPFPTLPLQQLTIQDLNIDRLTLETAQGTLAGASFHLGDWQLLRDGKWQPLQHFSFSGHANRLAWQGLELAKLSVEGEMSAGQLRVQEADARLLDGRITTSLSWNLPEQQLAIDDLQISGMRFQPLPWPEMPLRGVTLKQAALQQVTLTQSDGVTLNDLNLTLQDGQWQRDGLWRGKLQGKLGELVFNRLSLSELRGELTLDGDDWQGQLQGQLFEGTFAAAGHYQPTKQHLTLDEVQMAQWQLELPADWRTLPPSWPLQQLTIRRLDGHQLQLISFDESLPLSLKGGELFITDLNYTPAQGLQPASDKLRWETSWGELVYAGLTSRGGEAQGEISTDSYRLRELKLPLEKSQLKAEGEWRRDDLGLHQLTIQARQLDLDKLNALLHPKHELAGSLDLEADLHSQGHDRQSLLRELGGTLRLEGKELFLDGIRLDNYLDGALQQLPKRSNFAALYPQIEGGDTGINQLALHVQGEAGQLTLDGALASITHLLAVRGKLDLTRQQWQSELGVLNQQHCAELTARMTGALANPDFSFKSPTPCQPWPKGQVAYPPQGRRGALRD
ncbi:MAG: AsmA family protein [Aeromonadaceae bacterium]